MDNTLSRAVAQRDPGQVVMLEGALGAVATSLLAAAFGEGLPTAAQALALLAVGATGCGLSLRLYLLAQRAFGAARTGSVFAFAPFVGAALALALGERSATAWMLAGALPMIAGVVVHLGECHEHEHGHGALEHEHAHRHDDLHHDHFRAAMPMGPHSHWHRHEPLRHSHPHVPDEHHARTHSRDRLGARHSRAPRPTSPPKPTSSNAVTPTAWAQAATDPRPAIGGCWCARIRRQEGDGTEGIAGPVPLPAYGVGSTCDRHQAYSAS